LSLASSKVNQVEKGVWSKHLPTDQGQEYDK